MTMLPEDVRRIGARIPAELQAVMDEHPLVVAGGFCRAVVAGEEPKDVDVFAPDADVVIKAAAHLIHLAPASRTVETDNAVTVLVPGWTPVQFVRCRMVDGPRAAIDSFDFSVCQAAVSRDYGSWSGEVGEGFYADLAARRLRYMDPKGDSSSGGSLLRACKYLRLGYHMDQEQVARLIDRLLPVLRSGTQDEASEALRNLLRSEYRP